MQRRSVVLLSIIVLLTHFHPSQQTLQEIAAEQLQREFLTPLLMTPCIRQLMVKYSNESESEGAMTVLNVLHQSAGSQRQLLKMLMENLDMNFMIKRSRTLHYSPRKVIEKARMYCFLVVDASENEANVEMLRPLPTWNMMAKALVVFPFEMNRPTLMAQVTKSIKYLYETVGFYDVVVLGRELNSLKILSFSFFPYDRGNCAKEVKHIQLVDECEMVPPPGLELNNFEKVNTYVHSNLKDLLKMTEHRSTTGKVIPRISGCPINVSLSDFEPFAKIEPNKTISKGIEVNIIKVVLEEKLKAIVGWVPITPEVRYANFTVSNESGAFVDLMNRLVTFEPSQVHC